MNLSASDFDLMQSLISELYQFRTIEQFKTEAPHLLSEAVAADGFAWHSCKMQPQPKYIEFLGAEQWSSPELLAQWERTLQMHPFADHFIKTGDLSAVVLSDFVSQRQIDFVPYLREGLRPIGAKYLMSAGAVAGAGMMTGFSYFDARRDFTLRDKTMLNLLRPHALQARQNAERVSALIREGIACPGECQVRIGQLTPREREVGHWLACGKTNPEIGILLKASPRTIDKHVERILAKLGVENRTSAALMLVAITGEQ